MRGGPTPSTRRCLRTQVTRCEFYGALACEVDALVDTGSPATIVNEALAAAAGLFAIEDAEDEQGTTTTGLGGAATALRRCRAAGILVGGHALWSLAATDKGCFTNLDDHHNACHVLKTLLTCRTGAKSGPRPVPLSLIHI